MSWKTLMLLGCIFLASGLLFYNMREDPGREDAASRGAGSRQDLTPGGAGRGSGDTSSPGARVLREKERGEKSVKPGAVSASSDAAGGAAAGSAQGGNALILPGGGATPRRDGGAGRRADLVAGGARGSRTPTPDEFRRLAIQTELASEGEPSTIGESDQEQAETAVEDESETQEDLQKKPEVEMGERKVVNCAQDSGSMCFGFEWLYDLGASQNVVRVDVDGVRAFAVPGAGSGSDIWIRTGNSLIVGRSDHAISKEQLSQMVSTLGSGGAPSSP